MHLVLVPILVLVAGCSEKFPPVEGEPLPDTGEATASAGDDGQGTPGPNGGDDSAAGSFSGDVQWVTSGMGCFGDVQASFYTQTWDGAASMTATVAHTAGDGWEETHAFPDGVEKEDGSLRWELLLDIVADASELASGETTLFNCADTESDRFGWTLRVTAYNDALSEVGCHVLGHDV